MLFDSSSGYEMLNEEFYLLFDSSSGLRGKRSVFSEQVRNISRPAD